MSLPNTTGPDEDDDLLAAVDDDGIDYDAELGDEIGTDDAPPDAKPDPEPVAPPVNVDAERLQSVVAAQQAEAEAKARADAAQQAAVETRKLLLDAEKKLQDGDDIDPESRVVAQEKYQDAREALRNAQGWHQQAKQQLEQASQPINQAAAQWVAANPRFRSDEAFAKDAERVEAEMNAEAAKRGIKWDWTNPAAFAELDKRLKRPSRMQQRTSGPAPVSRAEGRERTQQPGSPGKAEGELMRRFGLDPSNKRHLLEWRHQKDLARQESAA